MIYRFACLVCKRPVEAYRRPADTVPKFCSPRCHYAWARGKPNLRARGAREETGVKFWRRFKPNAAGCWIWTGTVGKNGYGYFWIGAQRKELAHRWAYEYLRGPVPPDLELDHLCRVPRCVNPRHLEAVTHAENVRRALVKTHCLRGHAFTPENTDRNRIYPYARACKTCRRERARRRAQKMRAAKC